ncbi:MAG: hypothetical protein U0165_02645 [Polyangiaceae bacterium]
MALAELGGSGGTAGSSGSAGSAGSTSGGVTWTQLYNEVFGPTGTSHCTGSSCHTNLKGGFKCGTTKDTCYTGFVNAGLVSPGSSASSSVIVDPAQSPLCGTLGGSMPQGGTCVTSAQITEIKSWLADGAQNN